MVLHERDRPDAANIGLIESVARYALDAGYHVVAEGILSAARYGAMLQRLCADHRGPTRCYYLHVPFEETLRRHATKPQAFEYGEAEIRGWCRELDLLCEPAETVIGPDSALADTVRRIMSDTGLAALPPLER